MCGLLRWWTCVECVKHSLFGADALSIWSDSDNWSTLYTAIFYETQKL